MAFEVLNLDDEWMWVGVYQSAEGSEQAVDLDDPCSHWLAPADESTPNYGRRLVASGLTQGTVLVVVGMSDTSESYEAGEIF